MLAEVTRLSQTLLIGYAFVLCLVVVMTPHALSKPVRSGVRENALWSLVILCTHAATASAAAAEHVTECLVNVIETDENACAIGYAMDALHRLGIHLPSADEAFRRTMSRNSLYPSDALSRPLGV